MNYSIIFNTLPVKNGGGLQKTLSLLKANVDNINSDKIVLICFSDSPFNIPEIKNKILLKHNNRLITELLLVFRILLKYKNPKFFTLSGPSPWPLYFSNISHVTECAYSNLFYDIDFWIVKNKFELYKKKLIDFYRFYSCKFSTITIFQTSKMLEKAINKGFNEKHSFIVKPAYNNHLFSKYKFPEIKPKNNYKILFLCGSQRHKRIELINYLILNSKFNYDLYTTMDSESKYFLDLQTSLQNKIQSIGKLPPHKIPSILGDYDIICNLSSLESFSNNFIEAWASKRILLCVKEEWSVFEANEAALYLDLADIKNSVLEIDDFLSSEISIKKYLQLTNKKLKMYNNYTSKYHEYLKIIKNA